ncbi:MAG: Prolipoprotein diacylglyceryl transferase, partial [uncultured Solirubrobacterales bacterium]
DPGDRHRTGRAPDLRDHARAVARLLRPARGAAVARARQARRLGLRDGPRRRHRRRRRSEARLDRPEPRSGLRRERARRRHRSRARVLRGTPGRRARGRRVGLPARVPGLEPARPRRSRGRARLRPRADRLSALRRRRLRRAERPAVGDGLSGRHRADHRPRPPDADLRDAGHGARDGGAVEPPRSVRARCAVRPVPGDRGRGAVPDRVHPAQRLGAGGADDRAGDQRGDGGRGLGVDRVARAGGAPCDGV